jgi:hypothetical protein
MRCQTDEQLVAGCLSKPLTAAWQVNVTQQMRDAPVALQKAISDKFHWPRFESAVFSSKRTLNHYGRMRLCTFLWGNNIGMPTILLLLAPLVKIEAMQDVKNILKALMARTYESKWYYFDARWKLFLYLDGRIKSKWTADYGVADRIHNYQWERYMNAHRNKGLGYPNFAVKRKFEEAHKLEWDVP